MSEGARFTAWITRYALTTGIEKCEVQDCFDISPDMVARMHDVHYSDCIHKPDWHRSWDEAFARAEQMRAAKIASLRKQIEKLSHLTFAEHEL